MKRWTAIVLALSESPGEEMVSRLDACLHPIAGRPLIWHAVNSVASLDSPPDRVCIVAAGEFPPELFQDVPLPVSLHRVPEAERARVAADIVADLDLPADGLALVLQAATLASADSLQGLLDAAPGWWLDADGGGAAAALVAPAHLASFLRLPDPLRPPNGVLAARHHLAADGPLPLVVRDREGLARATARIRNRLVRTLMRRGATFLLPDSVLVDVDVRIGRDSMIFPGVVLEGQTTIGEETVIGPGCRIVDSWVGSGVELKGWNYISHTSVRNRAILEPYVRRGFD